MTLRKLLIRIYENYLWLAYYRLKSRIFGEPEYIFLGEDDNADRP